MVPPGRLTPAEKATLDAWLKHSPINHGRMPHQVFPGPSREAINRRALCWRMVRRGLLIPVPHGGYRIEDWALAALLAHPEGGEG